MLEEKPLVFTLFWPSIVINELYILQCLCIFWFGNKKGVKCYFLTWRSSGLCIVSLAKQLLQYRLLSLKYFHLQIKL